MGKKQVNFNISATTLYKVKAIVLKANGVDGSKTNSDLYNEAIEAYIEAYEKKNGKIKLP